MSTITTINAGDNISNSRTVINTNFSNLNTDKIETSVLDTDTTLAANSDSKVATQKAVKAYVDAGGNVNASTTGKGIVEEATQDEVDAGTAAGGTGARLFVNPSAATASTTSRGMVEQATTAEIAAGTSTGGTGAPLFVNPSSLPSALTLIPLPNSAFDQAAVIANANLANNTILNVGQIIVPFRITVNKISFYCSSVAVAGAYDITLYSEDGQTQLFSVTSASLSGSGIVTIAVSSVSLSPGIYYIAVNSNGSMNVSLAWWSSSVTDISTLLSVSSEPSISGTLSITAGTPPATITPTSISAAVGKTLLCRLDN